MRGAKRENLIAKTAACLILALVIFAPLSPSFSDEEDAPQESPEAAPLPAISFTEEGSENGEGEMPGEDTGGPTYSVSVTYGKETVQQQFHVGKYAEICANELESGLKFKGWELVSGGVPEYVGGTDLSSNPLKIRPKKADEGENEGAGAGESFSLRVMYEAFSVQPSFSVAGRIENSSDSYGRISYSLAAKTAPTLSYVISEEGYAPEEGREPKCEVLCEKLGSDTIFAENSFAPYQKLAEGNYRVAVKIDDIWCYSEVFAVGYKPVALELTSLPAKTKYEHGDEFDPSGVTIKAAYNNGSVAEDFRDYVVSYENGAYLKKGDTKLTIKAYEGNASLELAGLSVGEKTLEISGFEAEGREYDATKTVALSEGKLIGIAGQDEVSALWPAVGSLETPDAGKDKAVSFTEITLKGSDAGNYTIVQPKILVDISPRSIAGANDAVKFGTQSVYDGKSHEVAIESVKFGDFTLGSEDYEIVSGGTATNVGQQSLIIQGKGNFTGTPSPQAWSLRKAVPTAADFEISEPKDTVYDGTPKSISMPLLKSPKSGAGSLRLYYEGVDDTSYERSENAPMDAGKYKAVFDVEEGTNFSSASALEIGILSINKAEYEEKSYEATVPCDSETEGKIVALPVPPEGASYGEVSISGELVGSAEIVNGNALKFSAVSMPSGTRASIEIAVSGAKNYLDYTYIVSVEAVRKARYGKALIKDFGLSEGGLSYAVELGDGLDKLVILAAAYDAAGRFLSLGEDKVTVPTESEANSGSGEISGSFAAEPGAASYKLFVLSESYIPLCEGGSI